MPAHEDVRRILGRTRMCPLAGQGLETWRSLALRKLGCGFLTPTLGWEHRGLRGAGGPGSQARRVSRTRFPHHHLSTARAGSTLSTAQGPAQRLPMTIKGGGGQGVSWNPSDDLAPPSVGAAAGPRGGCPQQSPSHGPCCSHAPPRRASGPGLGGGTRGDATLSPIQ